MTRHLLILRHGKAVPYEGDDSDFDRPLKKRGKRQAQKIGVWLHENGLVPDSIITSSAVRCRETAKKCIKAAGRGTSGIQQQDELFHAMPATLHHTIANAPADWQCLLLVGHNPGLEALVYELAGDHDFELRNGQVMNTGTLVHFTVPDKALMPTKPVHHIRPEDLPDSFPYPATNPTERRKRPAYYYRQAAALPYRFGADGLEFMAIKSRYGEHLGIPKGIHDPGLTGFDAAAKEAFEEAGILGQMSQQACGQYNHDKWGATCTVTVYPMRVTHVLPTAEWPESDERERCWVSAKKLAKNVKQDGLRPIIGAFADIASETGND